MDFYQEVEDEVKRDAVLQKLNRTLVNLSNKVWIYSTQVKTPSQTFHFGDSLRYTMGDTMRDTMRYWIWWI